MPSRQVISRRNFSGAVDSGAPLRALRRFGEVSPIHTCAAGSARLTAAYAAT
jgi:hypothetical protein